MRRFWLAREAPADADPLRLLRGTGDRSHCLFGAPGGDLVAGLGEAATRVAARAARVARLAEAAAHLFAELEPLTAATSTEPVLVGGFGFDHRGSPTGSPWSALPPARLALPEVALRVRGASRRLVAVAPAGSTRRAARARREALLAGAEGRLRSPAPDPAPARLRPLGPGPGDYERRVAEAIDAIAGGHLTKVIVARREAWTAGAPLEAADLLGGLRDRFPTCFLFSVQPPGGPAFVGASPERLVAVRRGRVEADALAGTAPRADDPDRDRLLAEELAGSDKEQREHRVVVEHLRRVLRPLVRSLEVPARPGLLRLANVQHLHTPVRGRLLNGAGALDVAGRVHPTPAVCGLPRDEALTWLRRREELDRGWYAGGVGVVRPGGDGEFCVAIRSALLSGRRAWLFAGAGVVAGSLARRERAEVEHKLEGMREVLFRVGA